MDEKMCLEIRISIKFTSFMHMNALFLNTISWVIKCLLQFLRPFINFSAFFGLYSTQGILSLEKKQKNPNIPVLPHSNKSISCTGEPSTKYRSPDVDKDLFPQPADDALARSWAQQLRQLCKASVTQLSAPAFCIHCPHCLGSDKWRN